MVYRPICGWKAGFLEGGDDTKPGSLEWIKMRVDFKLFKYGSSAYCLSFAAFFIEKDTNPKAVSNANHKSAVMPAGAFCCG